MTVLRLDEFRVLEPTQGSDHLFGGGKDDSIDGLGGDDTIEGRGGNDWLTGGENAPYDEDIVYGGSGNDTLVDGKSADYLLGGGGDDLFIATSPLGFDVFAGDNGDDVYDLTGIRAEGTLSQIQEDADSGYDTIIIKAEDLGQYYVRPNVEKLVLVGSASSTVWGRQSADRIVGNAGDNWVQGDGGDDAILGDKGRDELFGGGGDDEIKGGSGADGIDGSIDDDGLYGGGGADFLYGGSGHDRLKAGDGEDVIYDDAGQDRVFGGAGNDTIYGGEGDDVFNGDDGDDVLGWYLSTEESGNDRYFGGAGADRFNYLGGKDVIKDFQDDVDTLGLTTFASMHGFRTAREALDMAVVTDAGVVIDFGGGDVLTIAGIDDVSVLYDDTPNF